MENTTEPFPDPGQTPFDHITLAFSGGGFRAAAFSLGVLSYLETVDNSPTTDTKKSLLDHVTFISSASGGTITNGMYALNSASGKDFDAFYKQLFLNLKGTDLLDVVLAKLNDDKEWKKRPDKRRNLINAFALAYDSCLFNSKLLGELYNPASGTHLQEVCFNTTELYRGLLFRQNVKMQDDSAFADKNFRYGNFVINLQKNAAEKLKLADLLAASSCFPAGFEPIIFPNDFTYNVSTDPQLAGNNLDERTLLNNLKICLQSLNRDELDILYGKSQIDEILKKLPVPVSLDTLVAALLPLPLQDGFKLGMMDGGITDNQALESMLDAQERRNNKQTSFEPFDLMLVNDVGSNFMDPYELPKENDSYTGLKGITINSVNIILTVLGLLGIAITGYGLFTASTTFFPKISLVLGTILILISSTLLGGILFLRTYIQGNIGNMGGLDLDKNFSPAIVNSLFSHFGSTPFMIILRMIRERISSILLLNNDVFLKRIRYLLYNSMYESKKYLFRVKANHVYDLCFSNDLNRKNSNLPNIWPSSAIQIVAQAAFEMATTLWFDKAQQTAKSQAAVIACGQFSTCYNLMEYIIRLKTTKRRTTGLTYYATLTPEYKQKVDRIETQLQKDYDRFKLDPFWLYNQYGTNIKIDGFTTCSMHDFPFPSGEFKGLR